MTIIDIERPIRNLIKEKKSNKTGRLQRLPTTAES